MLQKWKSRQDKLNHDWAIVGWALSVSEDVREDVKERMTGGHRDAIERVITRMFQHPCHFKISGLDTTDMGAIIGTFWEEFKDFQNKSGDFEKKHKWNSPHALQGKSHLWHEMYSLHHTKVLGIVACRSTSKPLGIGPAERSWKDVKFLKSGNSAHIGAERIEKQSILYTTARLNDARIRRDATNKDEKKPDSTFTDDDIK